MDGLKNRPRCDLASEREKMKYASAREEPPSEKKKKSSEKKTRSQEGTKSHPGMTEKQSTSMRNHHDKSTINIATVAVVAMSQCNQSGIGQKRMAR